MAYLDEVVNYAGDIDTGSNPLYQSLDHIKGLIADSYNLKQPPIIEGRYKQLQDAQIKQAQDFRSGIPNTAKSLMQNEQENSRLALAQKLGEVDRGANRRGLLYGGQRAAGRVGAAANNMQELAQKRAQINTSLQNTANTMDQQAIETGFGMAGAGQNALSAQDSYNRQQVANQMNQQNQQNNAYGSLFKGLGQGIGTAFGSQKPVKTPAPEQFDESMR